MSKPGPGEPPLRAALQTLFGDGLRAVLARGAGTAFVLQGVGALLAFALQVALARWMAVPDYGSYAYVFAWATVLSVPVALGVPGVLLRFVPTYVTQADQARLGGVIRAGALAVLAAGITFGLLGSAAVFALHETGAIGRWQPALLGVWLTPVLSLALVEREALRGLRRMALAYGPGFVLRPLAILTGAWLVWRSADGLSTDQALAVTLVATLALVLLQIGPLGWLTSRAVGSTAPRFDPATWRRVALALLLTTAFTTMLRQTDILVVGSLLGADDTAFYSAAARTASLVSFVLVATNGMAAPLLAGLHAAGDHAALQRLATTVARWTFWPSLALAVGLALLAEPVLRLFGNEFAEARWALVLLVAAQLVNAATGSVGYLLTLTGHQNDAARVYGTVALANLALVPLGTLTLGIEGAAVATALSTVAWNLWLHRLVLRRTGVEASIVSGASLGRLIRR